MIILDEMVQESVSESHHFDVIIVTNSETRMHMNSKQAAK